MLYWFNSNIAPLWNSFYEKVQVIGFGNFEVRERAARKGRNPQSGEEIQIEASKVPAFKAGKALKDAVKN